MNLVRIRWSIAGFLAVSCLPALGQSQTFNEVTNANPNLTIDWSTPANWSGGVVPGTTSTVYNVTIGSLQPGQGEVSPTLYDILVSTESVDSVQQLTIGNLTFNPTVSGSAVGVQILQNNNEQLLIEGNITNSTALQQEIDLPVFAGANSSNVSSFTYAGGTGGLLFGGALDLQNDTIATTGTVTLGAQLSFDITLNPTTHAVTYGSIGKVNVSSTTSLQVGNGSSTSNYLTTATVANDSGDFFQVFNPVAVNGSNAPTASGLPTFTNGLTWVTSLAPKGILFVEPTDGNNVIKAGVTLPIDNDTEFNNPSGGGTGSITLAGGELLTSNNILDIPLGVGTAFSTSRNIALAPVTSGANVIAATSGTVATFSGAISDNSSTADGANAGTGALTLGAGTNTGTIVFSGTNTYTGGTMVSNNTTLEVENAAGSATGSGTVILNSGASLIGNQTLGSSVAGSVTLLGSNSISSAAGTLTIGNGNMTNGINVGNGTGPSTGNHITGGTVSANVTTLNTGTTSLTIDSGATLQGAITQKTGSTFTVNGSATGTDAMMAGATLAGSGTV
ncbi:MAG TPA: hypothetical protein VGC39_06220, partial [Candidatus Methylacidiphilales bacterium]